MLADFLPENDLERVFIQASTWNARRVWREGVRSLNREDWDKAAVQFLNLANHYAIKNENTQLLEVVGSICGHSDHISPIAKRTLCKLCFSMVTSLFDTGDIIGDTRINILLIGMLKLTSTMQNRDLLLVDMLSYLRTLFRREITAEQLYPLALELEPKLPNHTLSAKNALQKQQNTEHAQKCQTHSVFKTGLSKNERLQILHNNLSNASREHGNRSPQVAGALVNLVQRTANTEDTFSTAKFLGELLAILGDANVNLNEYQLREIAALRERLPSTNELLNLAESLERLIFARKETLIGYDAGISVLLIRFIDLWLATGKMEDGKTFCASLSERVSKMRSENDIALRQIRSAENLLEQLNESFKPVENILSYISNSKLDEPTEFISIITLVTLDKMNGDKLAEVAPELHELLAYYNDCTGDSARKVGEMLWLLLETELRDSPGFAQRLALLSLNKAADPYLCRRLMSHLDHVNSLHPNLMQAQTLRKHCQNRLAELLSNTEALAGLPNNPGISERSLALEKPNEVLDLRKIDLHVIARDWIEAEKQISELLEAELPTNDQNQLRIRLARVYVGQADLLKASTVIHKAFSSFNQN